MRLPVQSSSGMSLARQMVCPLEDVTRGVGAESQSVYESRIFVRSVRQEDLQDTRANRDLAPASCTREITYLQILITGSCQAASRAWMEPSARNASLAAVSFVWPSAVRPHRNRLVRARSYVSALSLGTFLDINHAQRKRCR